MTSSNYSAVILPQAETDISDILNYIATDLANPTAANKLWREIKEAIERAKMFPYAMPILKNKQITLGKEYRMIDINSHVVIYKIVEELKQIRIFAVFYGPSNIIAKVLNRI